ncbi:MAG: alpha/beta fold hydrolase [Pirellulales bacterium]
MPDIPRPNLPLPTFGGKQFWADRLHFRGWRVQQHVVSGHCRLLDPRSIRRAWGPYERCVERLDDAKRRLALAPLDGEIVVALHGLFRARTSMGRLCRFLHDEASYEVCNVSYPSTRADVASHARNLASIVAGLDGATRVHFVGHSMGNIVVRRYLADRGQASDDEGLPPVGRMVMIAPPNQGAQLARRLARLGLLHVVLGRPLAELGRDWSQLERGLATPREFGVIAGGRGRTSGYNPLLTGDDDLVVSVEETRLDGASDFIVLPAMHAFIMNRPEVQRQTAHFLKTGTFDHVNQQ